MQTVGLVVVFPEDIPRVIKESRLLRCTHMSIWKVRHSLSPIIEASLIALALAYGVFVIYLASVKPLVVALTPDVRSVPAPLSLDTDEWIRATNVSARYVFGIPKGWTVDDSDTNRIIVGRNLRALRKPANNAIIIETRMLGERNQIENIAVAELSDSRPALYDVAVHGRPGLFSVEFLGNRIMRQTVYVQSGRKVHIIRAGSLDPAVFSAFISTMKFLPESSP